MPPRSPPAWGRVRAAPPPPPRSPHCPQSRCPSHATLFLVSATATTTQNIIVQRYIVASLAWRFMSVLRHSRLWSVLKHSRLWPVLSKWGTWREFYAPSLLITKKIITIMDLFLHPKTSSGTYRLRLVNDYWTDWRFSLRRMLLSSQQ